VKLEDPVAPFRGIVASHRRAHASANAECLRLGGRSPSTRPRPSTGPVAVLGASGWALGDDQVERTAAYVGALGGLLADFGYDVFAIGSAPDLDTVPAFVGWVGGEETAAELAQLAAFDAPGLSVSSGAVQVNAWARIEPEGQPTSIEFIRTAFEEIRRLTDSVDQSSPDPSEVESSTG